MGNNRQKWFDGFGLLLTQRGIEMKSRKSIETAMDRVRRHQDYMERLFFFARTEQVKDYRQTLKEFDGYLQSRMDKVQFTAEEQEKWNVIIKDNPSIDLQTGSICEFWDAYNSTVRAICGY